MRVIIWRKRKNEQWSQNALCIFFNRKPFTKGRAIYIYLNTQYGYDTETQKKYPYHYDYFK